MFRIDKRLKIFELKKQLSQKLQLSIDNFRLKHQESNGIEIKVTFLYSSPRN